MMMNTGVRRRVASAALASACFFLSSMASADGSQTLGLTEARRGRGLSAAAYGVGLSARTAGAPGPPVTSADIVVDTLPSGAVIERAYLYWVTYGEAGAGTIELDGAAITGAAIGNSAGTCWDGYPTFDSYAFRADVTDRVTGNATFEVTGFPSGTAIADTQGTVLVVLYTDPADDAFGTVLLHDGSMTLSSTLAAQGEFVDVRPPATAPLSAHLLLGAGDGEVVIPEGPLRFDETPLASFGGQHWSSSAGNYWDVRRYDVASLLDPDDGSVTWSAVYGSDCLVFVYAALAFRAAEGEESDAGVGPSDAGEIDGGGPDAGAIDGGGLDAAVGLDAGRIDAGPPSVGSTGCGCRASTAEGTTRALWVLVLIGSILGRRARR